MFDDKLTITASGDEGIGDEGTGDEDAAGRGDSVRELLDELGAAVEAGDVLHAVTSSSKRSARLPTYG